MTQNKTKNHIILFGVLGAVLLNGCAEQNMSQMYDTVNVTENVVIDENSVPIFPKKAALTTDTAQRFALDLPKRCMVDWNNQSVVSVVPEEKIEIVRLNTGDKLPDLKVSDFNF